MSICPNNTYCNLPLKRCDRYSLAFLEDVEGQEPNVAFAQPPSPIDFFNGFMEGFALFNDVPNKDLCKPVDPQIGEDVNDIISIIKNLTMKSDFKEVISQVLPRLNDIYTRVLNIKEGCEAYSQEIKKIVKSLRAHVLRLDYLRRLAIHTFQNYGEISQKLQDAISLIGTLDLLESGRSFGALVRFLYYWDFKTTKLALRDRPEDFFVGFIQGFSLFNDVPNKDLCKPTDPEIVEDINFIVEILKDLNIKSDFGEIINKLLTKLQDIYTRALNIKEGCEAFAREIKKIVEKLRAHVLRIDYLPRLGLHTFQNLGEISQKLQEATSLRVQNNFLESGRAFGGLYRFIYFWDFKTLSLTFVEKPRVRIDPVQAKDFIVGLNEGFTFFRSLPNYDQCSINGSDYLKDIEEILEILDDVSISNIVEVIPQLISKGLDVIQKLSQTSETCSEFAKEAFDVFNKLKYHVESVSYATEFIVHTTQNIREIKNRVKNGSSLMSNNQFKESGNAFGNVAKFAFFWSFNN
jgi:predicted CopG family antitoxin